jgi:hypothetical protein
VIFAEGAAWETLQTVTVDDFDFEEYRKLYGDPFSAEEPAAPILGYNGRRAMLRGHLPPSRRSSTFAPNLTLCATIWRRERLLKRSVNATGYHEKSHAAFPRYCLLPPFPAVLVRLWRPPCRKSTAVVRKRRPKLGRLSLRFGITMGR